MTGRIPIRSALSVVVVPGDPSKRRREQRNRHDFHAFAYHMAVPETWNLERNDEVHT